MQEHFPIWFCLVQDDPFIPQLRVRRIIKVVKTSLSDVEQVYKDHESLCYGTNRVTMELFHRDPTDSPLLEAARKQGAGILPEDIDVAISMTQEEYKDW